MMRFSLYLYVSSVRVGIVQPPNTDRTHPSQSMSDGRNTRKLSARDQRAYLPFLSMRGARVRDAFGERQSLSLTHSLPNEIPGLV